MYIDDWSKIDPDKKYIAFAVNRDAEGNLYLARPTLECGWQVRHLMEKVYVALEIPNPDAALKELQKQWNTKQKM